MRKQSIGAVGGCVALLATACATSGDMQKMEERLGTIEQRLADVERRSAAAQSAAEQAATDARLAAQNANRADAMFQKTVEK